MFLTVDANCWDCYPSRGWSEWFVEVHSFLYIYCHAELFWCKCILLVLCHVDCAWNCSLVGVHGWDPVLEMPHSETVPIRWPVLRSHLHNDIQQSTRETVMTVVTQVVKCTTIDIKTTNKNSTKEQQSTEWIIIHIYILDKYKVLCYSKSKSSNWFW